MRVHVLLYEAGKDTEGIHSLELSGETVVLMFENFDDAARYAGLLEAQDFPLPAIEVVEREEVEIFCLDSGYKAKFIEIGFVPKTDEERLLLAPPEANRDVTNWNENHEHSAEQKYQNNPDSKVIDDFRKSLEDLI